MPRGALPQTTKNTKQKQRKSPKPQKTSKSDGNQRKWYGVPQWGLAKNHQHHQHSKNKQHQQNHQKPPNLIEIKKGMVGDAPPTKNPTKNNKK